MELSEYKKLKKSNLFISLQVNNYCKFVAFIKKMRKGSDGIIRFYPHFLIEIFKKGRSVRAFKYNSKCSWDITLDCINVATENDIKVLYKHLKFNKDIMIV